MKTLTHIRFSLFITALFTLILLNASTCDDQNVAYKPVIPIPACACILRGTQWTKDNAANTYTFTENSTITNNVNNVIADAGKKIWLPQAGIGIVPQIDASGGVPVIDYPNLNRGLGDLENVDGEDAAQKCRAAWGKAMVPGGLVIIIAHKLVSAPESGFAPDPAAVYQRNNHQDLCSVPRQITATDMNNKWIVIEDPTLLGLNGEKGNGIPYVVLAHELGHVFLLMHGNGLDDDSNGVLPPTPGPRLFDLGCDTAEYKHSDLKSTKVSLMIDHPGYIQNLTPLQIEVARAAVPLMPGAFGNNK